MKLSILLICLIAYSGKGSKDNDIGRVAKQNWKFHFPTGSAMGLFLAIAIPLAHGKNAYLAYNFEAIYRLPNATVDYEYPPLVARTGKAFNRRFIYDAIEAKLNMYGYSAKNCMLRTICESAEASVKHNGVLGDILHIIFTPSSSNDTIQSAYDVAETQGRAGKCANYHKNCAVSFLDMISWIGDAVTV